MDTEIKQLPRKSSAQMTRLQRLLAYLPPLNLERPFHLKNFTLFPKLPLELRRRIVAFAAHEPRDILLCYGSDQLRTRQFVNSRNRSQLAIPAILHVSVEFRAEGLRYYTSCEWDYVNFKTPQALPRPRFPSFMYANFDVDHFNNLIPDDFDSPTSLNHCAVTSETIARIKYLDCRLSDGSIVSKLKGMTPALESMPSLRQTNVIISGGIYLQKNDTTFIWERMEYIWGECLAASLAQEAIDEVTTHFNGDPKNSSLPRNVELKTAWKAQISDCEEADKDGAMEVDRQDPYPAMPRLTDLKSEQSPRNCWISSWLGEL